MVIDNKTFDKDYQEWQRRAARATSGDEKLDEAIFRAGWDAVTWHLVTLPPDTLRKEIILNPYE